MSAAMHLSVLVSLLTVCCGTTISPVDERGTVRTTGSHNFTNSSVETTTILQSQKTTHQLSTEGTTASPQTPRTEGTNQSTSLTTTSTSQTSNETVSQEHTVPSTSESPNITESIKVNATSPVLSPNWDKDDFAANPGLVVITCIFCIVLALVLVVVAVKCIRSPRSNFERLEEVPMDPGHGGSILSREAQSSLSPPPPALPGAKSMKSPRLHITQNNRGSDVGQGRRGAQSVVYL